MVLHHPSLPCSDMFVVCRISAAGLVRVQPPVFCGVADNLLSGIVTLTATERKTVHGCNIVRLDCYMIDPRNTSSSLCSEEKNRNASTCVCIRLPEYLHGCLSGLSVIIKAACCSLSLLCFLSSVLLTASLWW